MKSILALLLLAAILCISGCETFHALGKDVERAGNWAQEKAKQ